MTRSRLAIMVSLALLALSVAEAVGGCTVVINGRAIDPGQAICTEADRLLLSADALQHALGLTVVPGNDDTPWTIRGFGRSVLVRPGQSTYSVEQQPRRADTSPTVRDDQVFVPLEMLAGTFEIQAAMREDTGATIWTLTTPGAHVTDVRDGRHRDRVRIVLDVDRPTGIAWWTQPGLVTLELPAADGEGACSVRLLRIEDDLGDQIRQGPTATGSTRVEIAHSSQQPVELFTLPEPPRIVVDLQRAPEDIWPEPEPEPVHPLPTAAGVLETRNFCTPRGPVRIHVMDVDPSSSAIRVAPALASDTVHERSAVTRIAQRVGAWGGVNGGFFARGGPPLGMLVIDGEWIRDPWGGRTVLGIARDGALLMDRLQFDGRVVFSGHGWQPLAAINRGHEDENTLVMYNRYWGRVVEGAKGRTRLAVDASGTVVAKTTDGDALVIPESGFVLSGNGRMGASLDLVEAGTAVKLQLRTKPQWPELAHAIGGGPRLVKDGRPHITASPEGFRPDIYASAPSRTAVAITEENRLLLVVAEGVGETERSGMTLEELASTLIKLGARDAMNLDGGGSATFVADGQLRNVPSDGLQRRVSNALLVFTEEATRTDAGED